MGGGEEESDFAHFVERERNSAICLLGHENHVRGKEMTCDKNTRRRNSRSHSHTNTHRVTPTTWRRQFTCFSCCFCCVLLLLTLFLFLPVIVNHSPRGGSGTVGLS